MSGGTTTCAVIGGGAWGTAIADRLARNGHPTRLWAREVDVVEAVNARHENPRFLAGHALTPALRATSDMAAALRDAALVVYAAPSHVLRGVVASGAAALHPAVMAAPDDAALMHDHRANRNTPFGQSLLGFGNCGLHELVHGNDLGSSDKPDSFRSMRNLSDQFLDRLGIQTVHFGFVIDAQEVDLLVLGDHVRDQSGTTALPLHFALDRHAHLENTVAQAGAQMWITFQIRLDRHKFITQ